MNQKAFVAPFWMMIIIGSIHVAVTAFTIYLNGFHLSYYGQMKIIVTTFFFLWPVILFGEAFIYWRLRKRIEKKNWAWAHVLLTFFAIVVARLIVYIQTIMHFGAISNLGVVIIFWICLIVGHVFFIALLSSGIVKRRPDIAIEDGGVNLLDDIFDE